MWDRIKLDIIERLAWAEVVWRIAALIAFAWCIPAYRADPLIVPLIGAVFYQAFKIFHNDVKEEAKFQRMVEWRRDLG